MRGITRVAVVVFAVGIVACILLVLPARVREHADRERCRNNLRLVAIALENYHDSMWSFPAAGPANPDLPPDAMGDRVVVEFPPQQG